MKEKKSNTLILEDKTPSSRQVTSDNLEEAIVKVAEGKIFDEI
jgi:hypothetical protein